MKKGYLLFLSLLIIAGLMISIEVAMAEDEKADEVIQPANQDRNPGEGSGISEEPMVSHGTDHEKPQPPVQADTSLELPQEDGYRIYTVQKGDTLWDITHNILKEPFLWPKVWNANPDIKNPDLIYPGQSIKIPLSVLRPELVSKEPEIRPEEVEALKGKESKPGAETVKKPEELSLRPSVEVMEEKIPEYLIDRNLLLESGYISRTIPDAGRIIGNPQGRSTVGKGDYVYIRTNTEAKKGDKFYVIRAVSEVKHPHINESLGYLIEINGIIEVIGEESGMLKAEVKESFKEIDMDDRLDNFYLIEPPLKPEKQDFPKINASIVAIRHLYKMGGAVYDIVYIDKGSRDGLSTGSLLNVFSDEKPVVPLGTIQIINVREETATAVVRKGLKEIVPGDRIINE